jgi:hypothetical protein
VTTIVDICNRALQVPGTRTSVTSAELAANSTNEAIQLNLVLHNVRKRLLRMAPWGCALKTENLVYITSVPGTPENSSPATTLWARGQPTPPWAYEYQYPVDCLQAAWIIPAENTGFGSGSIPITTAVTGGAPSLWRGAPIKFAVQTDIFRPVTAAVVAAGGTGYAVGDVITLATNAQGAVPIGAPAKLTVATLSGSSVATVTVNTQVLDASSPSLGGSYFLVQSNPVAQGSTTGSGTGATFTLTQGAAAPQRVILTNQEFATLVYVGDVTDPNVFDDTFQDAFAKILGAMVTIPLTGDKRLANMAIESANQIIMEARTADADEGLTINDVTPDWIRIRGIDFNLPYSSANTGFDWGGLWSTFG